MTPMTQTRSVRRGLSALGILSLLVVGCVPAPSVTSLPNASTPPSASLKVQGLIKTEIEQATLEPSPYHEVRLSAQDYFEPVIVVPLEERASYEAQATSLYFESLKPDPANPDRFVKTDSDVTHLAYYFNSSENFIPAIVVERGEVLATRATIIGYGLRLAFPQATSGPVTVKANNPAMGLMIWKGDDVFVQRELSVTEDQLTPLEDAKDAVVVFSVTNLEGEPINGLAKDQVQLRIYDPSDEYDERAPLPIDKFEAIAEGKYRIRLPLTPGKPSGKLRFEVEVVNPSLPVNATFYRH